MNCSSCDELTSVASAQQDLFESLDHVRLPKSTGKNNGARMVYLGERNNKVSIEPAWVDLPDLLLNCSRNSSLMNGTARIYAFVLRFRKCEVIEVQFVGVSTSKMISRATS